MILYFLVNGLKVISIEYDHIERYYEKEFYS